jgi:hypothetical protein
MTKLDTYKCDRCKKTFTVDTEEEDLPHTIFLDGEQYDLCEDCFSAVYWCIEVNEEVDKAIEEILDKKGLVK